MKMCTSGLRVTLSYLLKYQPKKNPYYIKGLSILYYEFYGKTDNYKVNWYDDPECWAKKTSGKKAICIDISTSDIPLLYKITFHINTGILQAQGHYKDNFTKYDFPKLQEIVNSVMQSNKSDSATCIDSTHSNISSDTLHVLIVPTQTYLTH